MGKNNHISSLLAKPRPKALIIPAMDVLGRRSAEPGRGALGMGGRRGIWDEWAEGHWDIKLYIWDEWVGVKKAIATLHMHSQPRSEGMGGRGRIQLSGGGVGSGKFRFRVGPQELQDNHPNTQLIFMTMSSTLPYVYFGPWTRPPPPLRLFCRGGKATLATPGYTMVRCRATPGLARQQTKINVNPPLVFTSSST